MPSSFGGFEQTDLLPRNSFKDSRLRLGSLAGVQPPQEPRSNLKLYAENERLEPENHPIEKEHHLPNLTFFEFRLFILIFCVVICLISFER